MENQNYSTVLAQGPFEAYLAHSYALATNDYSVHHYSVPAYLAATSGIDDVGFGVYNAVNIGNLADSANRTWAAFEEGMPQPCDTTTNWTDGYDTAHNPFIMYRDIASNTTRCDAHDLTWSSWTNDVRLNSIPNYSFITPNATDDDHNSSVPVGDAWLESWLSPLINDTAIFSNTAFLISYDESGTDSSPTVHGSSGGQVYAVVVSPYSQSLASGAFYNTFSLLTSAEWLLRLRGGTLGNDNWTLHPPMNDLFSFGSSASEVTFQESGLTPATQWSVAMEGVVQSSTTSGISFSESNGTYPYAVGSVPGYVEVPSLGLVTVAGTGMTVPVAFNRTYSVTFTEKGLPKGTPWNVTLASETIRSNRSTMVFLEPNGTYTFQFGIVPGWKTTDTGSVRVAGSDASLTRTFTQVRYVVTFKETGLPSGTNWSVLVGTTTLWSTLTHINFHLANGSYAYSVANVANYSRTAAGTFAVSGSGLTIAKHFTVVQYKVMFTESGLPVHTSWQVTIGSSCHSTTGTTIAFDLTNGTDRYTVSTPGSGYLADNGTVTVNGGSLEVTISFGGSVEVPREAGFDYPPGKAQTRVVSLWAGPVA